MSPFSLQGCPRWAAFALILLCSCRFSGETNTPLNIGYIGTFTGGSAVSGMQSYRGAELGVEDWNRLHPKLQLRLKPADDHGLASLAQRAHQEFWYEGTRYFIGPFLTASAALLVQETFKHHSVILSPLVAGADFVAKDDYFFRLFPSSRDIGRALGLFIRSKRISRLAVISDFGNRDYALGIFDTAVAQLDEKRLVDHWVIPSELKGAHVAEKIREWRSRKVDGVLMILSSRDTFLVCEEMKRQNFTPLRISAPWAIDSLLLSGDAAEGLLFYIPTDYGNRSERYLAYVGAYQRKYDETPSHHATLSYVAVSVLAEAIRRAGAEDPEKVKAALISGESYPALQWPITFDVYGDARRDLVLHEVRDKQFTPVKTGAP